MLRVVPIALFLLGAGAVGTAAQQKTAYPLLPTGGMWQSIPPAGNAAERVAERVAETSAETPTLTPTLKPSAGRTLDRVAAAQPAKALSAKATPALRNPAPAADVPRRPPVETAAARTRELSRRIEVLAPGTKLDEPMNDPENPSWRRQPAGRAGAEDRAFSMPLDETGHSGFVARGYHEERSWYNTNSRTGATFGLRTRF